MKKRRKPAKCETCSGTGWFIIQDITQPHEIQRCDMCEKYPDDIKAADAYFKSSKCQHYLHSILATPRQVTVL